MLWLRKQAKGAAGGDEAITPASLEVALDPGILASKMEQLLDAVADHGGLEAYIAAMEAKHLLFAEGLTRESLEVMDREAVHVLLDTVFPARRRLKAVADRMDVAELANAMRELLHGSDPLAERMEAFRDTFPTEGDNKARRAAMDFAAELLHFRDPERYPLMTRWVWDVNTVSGAAREFIAGNDTMAEVPLGDSPETYEGVRAWMVETLAEQGFYRDLPYLVDLLFAWAYADYMRAMSSSMGLMKNEFGGDDDPTEPARKLLGIDAGRHGQNRNGTETVH